MARINIPPVTRILLIALAIQSFLSFAIRYSQWTASSQIVVPYLTLIPQLSLIYPWTFVTTTLVENNVFTLAAAGATVYNGGRYLERAWSSKEFGKFLLVVALIPNLLCFGTMVLLFAITQRESWTLSTIAGTTPLQISFLVAFSQLLPAHTVTLFKGILSLRVPQLPLLYLALITILSITPISHGPADIFLAIYAFLTSWTYLRFYKTVFPDLESSTQASTGLRGDASESFAFAEFFPGPAKKIVAAIGDQIFEVLVAMNVCTPFSAADVVGASSRAGADGNTAGGHIGGYRSAAGHAPAGGARAEAERRRALALKALDQRLNMAASRGTSATAAAASPSAASAAAPKTTTVTTTMNANGGGVGILDNQSGRVATPLPSGTIVQADPAASMGGSNNNNVLGETNYEPDHDKS